MAGEAVLFWTVGRLYHQWIDPLVRGTARAYKRSVFNSEVRGTFRVLKASSSELMSEDRVESFVEKALQAMVRKEKDVVASYGRRASSLGEEAMENLLKKELFNGFQNLSLVEKVDWKPHEVFSSEVKSILLVAHKEYLDEVAKGGYDLREQANLLYGRIPPGSRRYNKRYGGLLESIERYEALVNSSTDLAQREEAEAKLEELRERVNSIEREVADSELEAFEALAGFYDEKDQALAKRVERWHEGQKDHYGLTEEALQRAHEIFGLDPSKPYDEQIETIEENFLNFAHIDDLNITDIHVMRQILLAYSAAKYGESHPALSESFRIQGEILEDAYVLFNEEFNSVLNLQRRLEAEREEIAVSIEISNASGVDRGCLEGLVGAEIVEDTGQLIESLGRALYQASQGEEGGSKKEKGEETTPEELDQVALNLLDLGIGVHKESGCLVPEIVSGEELGEEEGGGGVQVNGTTVRVDPVGAVENSHIESEGGLR